MYDLIDLIDFTQTLVFPWQQPSELAEPKNLLFTSKRWSLQLITTLWLSEFRSFRNQAIYYSNWLRKKPDNVKLVRAVLITAELPLESETTKITWGFLGIYVFQGNTVYHNTSGMEDVFGSFWSVKTWTWRDTREVKNQSKRTWCEIRDEHISACTEYVHFNQEIRDKFEIEGRDAGWNTANHG